MMSGPIKIKIACHQDHYDRKNEGERPRAADGFFAIPSQVLGRRCFYGNA
jgi:hypothetical protein